MIPNILRLTAKTLIRLHGDSCRSESLLGAHAILLEMLARIKLEHVNIKLFTESTLIKKLFSAVTLNIFWFWNCHTYFHREAKPNIALFSFLHIQPRMYAPRTEQFLYRVTKGTLAVCVLQVKNKKRWSQIMYMSYVLDYLMVQQENGMDIQQH